MNLRWLKHVRSPRYRALGLVAVAALGVAAQFPIAAVAHASGEDTLVVGIQPFEKPGDILSPDPAMEVVRRAVLGSIWSWGSEAEGGWTWEDHHWRAELAVRRCSDGSAVSPQDVDRSLARCLPVELRPRWRVTPKAARGRIVLHVGADSADAQDRIQQALRDCGVVKAWAFEMFGESLGQGYRIAGCGPFVIDEVGRSEQLAVSRTEPIEGADVVERIRFIPLDDATGEGAIRSGRIQVLLGHSLADIPPGVQAERCGSGTVYFRLGIRFSCDTQLMVGSLRWSESSPVNISGER